MADQQRAVQRLMQAPDGTLAIVYIDLATLQPIDPSQVGSYKVINSTNPQVELVSSFDNPNDVQAVHDQKTGETTTIDLNYKGGRSQDRQTNQVFGQMDQTSRPDAIERPQSPVRSTPVQGQKPAIGSSVEPSPDVQQARNDVQTGPTNHPSWPSDASATRGISSPPRPSGFNWQGATNTPVQEDTAEESVPTPQARPSGVGFMSRPDTPSVPSSTNPNIGYSNQNAQRNQPLNPETESTLSKAVTGFFGPNYRADVVSGKGVMHNPDGSVSKKGNHNHPLGTAGDFDVYDTKGTESTSDDTKVTDPEMMKDFGAWASQEGFTGVGGPSEGYMGAGRMHLDTDHPNLAAWGGMDKQRMMDAQARGFAFPGPGAPVPTARPDYAPASPPMGDNQQPSTVAKNVISQAADVTKTKDNPVITKDVSNMSVGEMRGLGIGNFAERSPAEKEAIARTLAGEASKKTLDGLASGDPSALAEFDNMVSSIENRASSSKYPGGLKDVLTGSQYNSLMSSNLAVTNNNFSMYRDPLMKAVDSFYGASQATQPGATNYYNPDISDPNWGSKMKNPVDAGAHRFGILDSQYDNPMGPEARAERDRMSEAQKSDPTGFTGIHDYAGGGYSSRMDSPSEGKTTSRGGTYSGPDYSSPSEGSTTNRGGTTSGLGQYSPPDKDKDKTKDHSSGGHFTD